jgi:hypothetical protein
LLRETTYTCQLNRQQRQLFNLRKYLSELLILNKKFNEKVVKIGIDDRQVDRGILETLILSEAIITILSEALPINFSLEKAPWLSVHSDYIKTWVDCLPPRLEFVRLERSIRVLRGELNVARGRRPKAKS